MSDSHAGAMKPLLVALGVLLLVVGVAYFFLGSFVASCTATPPARRSAISRAAVVRRKRGVGLAWRHLTVPGLP